MGLGLPVLVLRRHGRRRVADGHQVTPLLLGGAFVWRSGLAIDADGSPRAYHPDGKSGLDYLANAGKPGNWWALVCNAAGVPIVQGPDDPAPGFYVPATSLVDRSRAAADPRRYVDSETVPYITATRGMLSLGCQLGDVAMVSYGALDCAAVVADVGPNPGEGSIALARALGLPSDPRHGGCSHPVVSFAVFKGSARGWPRSNEDVAAQAAELYAAWGGAARLLALLAA
jgi:hypothetical protein